MLSATYSTGLVFASIFIATLASYTTLNLANRIASLSDQRYRIHWLIGGALSMGMGIWSMHFVGMLSFALPIPLGYDLVITAASLVIAVFVSFFALDLVTKGLVSAGRLLASGTLMGIGISSMHYIGMEALQMSPAIQYDPIIFSSSIIIAVLASTAALWIALKLQRKELRHINRWRLAAALIMGLAISGMHYTGMAAANFPYDAVCMSASGISTNWLAVTTAGATLSILTITLVLSVLDSRLEQRTTAFVQSLQEINSKLQHQATHDPLTGLPNRALLIDKVQEAIDASSRSGERFALFFIDLDGFKAVNDCLGHAAGDALLKSIATRLRQAVRAQDIVARFGGDEFVVVAQDIADAALASRVAENLFACFHGESISGHTALTVSPSIGIALYPDNGQTVDDLLLRADAAMYEVKGAGRNHYRFFETSMHAKTMRAIELQRELPAALNGNQFFLQYQPKFDCHTGQMLGAEALIRWKHPQLGTISPAEFIPIAEQSGCIAVVGAWVIEEVCRQLREWTQAGETAMKIAVNLSQIQLRSPHFVEEVIRITGRHGVVPSMLMFEITETVAMQNAEETMRTIERLQQAGFALAIDDFGTGHSSLSYLQKFGVQQMKVDRSFIKNLTATGKIHSIVSAIIQLGHSLNMEVVAEGVETPEQRQLLQEMKCDQMQGFLMGRPMSSTDLIALSHRDDRIFDLDTCSLSQR